MPKLRRVKEKRSHKKYTLNVNKHVGKINWETDSGNRGGWPDRRKLKPHIKEELKRKGQVTGYPEDLYADRLQLKKRRR